MSQEKPSIKERLQGFFGRRPPRTETMMSRLHHEAGLIPILNLDDTEARRQEIKTIMDEIESALFEPILQRRIVKKAYALYFSAGNPWYRGLSNRELAKKVADFLEQYTVLGDMDEFIPDLFEEAQQLLSLSWQALDVTNTPAVFIESRPVVNFGPQGRGAPETAFDPTGFMELQEEVERLKQKERREQQ